MNLLSDMVGIDTSRLVRPWKLVLGLAILGLAPAMLVAEWITAASSSAL